jgi:TetR/AcrR family transcriptional regulator, lmrAB and yxaGH operons repressor
MTVVLSSYSSPMPRISDSRDRMVRSAATLFRRQGFAATGWRQVIAESNAPWGSQAHHFPGGKEQLAVDALTGAAEEYEQMLRHAMSQQGPAAAVRMWTKVGARELERSGWSDGCPIATVALETAAESDAIGAVCNQAFTSWRKVIAEALSSAGLAADEAADVALTVLAGIEGGLLLARAARDGNALITVGQQLAGLIETRIAAPAG